MDVIDLLPQGDPETVVLLPHGALVGLFIRDSGYGDLMLGIREDAEGRPVSCAITSELIVEYPPVQSNPRRQADGDDGSEDGS